MVAADGFGQIAQDVALLPLAGLCDGEQTRGRDFPVAAATAEADLAPLHRRA